MIRCMILFIVLYHFSLVGTAQTHIQNSTNDSLNYIVGKIANGKLNDRQKVKAVYDWITSNISYDYEREMSFKITGKDSTQTSIGDILKFRKGICMDYAKLAKAMLCSLNIKCELVTGIGRSGDNDLTDFSSPYNRHAWNEVMVDGKWLPLDCTWGSINKIGEKSDSTFFLATPAQFIYSHYPDSVKWIPQNTPFTSTQFFSLPIIYFENAEIALNKIPLDGVLTNSNGLFEYHNITKLDIKNIDLGQS